MYKHNLLTLAAALLVVAMISPATGQSNANDYDYNRTRVDRYLDAEIWTDHSQGEYYDGENIIIHYRANRDAFVAIYSIDTRGVVQLLFPTSPDDDNFIYGGVTNSLPAASDGYDLTVTGPEGFENIQIIASRERFPIPNWYHNSGLVADWDDRDEYMDWLNHEHFVRYAGQRFAYDRAVIYVNEWEEDYYRPVYQPAYRSWTIYGNSYIDYPYGGSVYINGFYWGIAPLYIPRIAVGWHTVTICDRYGYYWEDDFHVSRYNTVVFDRTIVKTSPTVKSKYKEVRAAGYRDPVVNGYPKFKVRAAVTGKVGGKTNVVVSAKGRSGANSFGESVVGAKKKFVRGSTKIVKTDRGYETDASTAVFSPKRTKVRSSATRNSVESVGSSRSGSTTRTRQKATNSVTTSGSSQSSNGNRARTRVTNTSQTRSKSTVGTKTKSGGASQRKSRVTSNSGSTSSGNRATVKKRSSSSSTKTVKAREAKSNTKSRKSSGKVEKRERSNSNPPAKKNAGSVKRQETKRPTATQSSGKSSKTGKSKSGGGKKRR